VNNPTFTGALSGPVMDVKATSNNIVYADQFAGATADVKISAALAQACPAAGVNTVPVTNGIVDARGLTGNQTIASTITMPPNCTLILGVGTYTRASGAQILFDSGDTISGANPGLGFTAQRATQIQGTAGDANAAIAYRYGTGDGGGIGAIVKDLSIYGPTTGTGISFVHVQGSQINNVAVGNVAVGLTMGFTGGCDCYNSFHEDQFFASGYGVQILTAGYANQNQFYGGRFGSTGSDAVYLGGVNNTFYSPDVEGSPTAFEFLNGSSDTLYAPYFEGNATDLLFDSGSVGGAVIGGTNPRVVDNSGNTSNFVFTSGGGANGGGYAPTMFAAQTLRLGGNLFAGAMNGGDLSLVNNGPDGGAQLLFSPQAQLTYGRTGGLPLHIGSLYASGGSSLNATAVAALPNPPAPTLTYTGTAGPSSYSYAVVCYTVGGAYNSMPSGLATINNAATALNASNYVTITPNCGPGYTGAAILKGGTSGTVMLASSAVVSPNTQGYNDTGQSLSAFAAIARNTTGDFSVAGYLNASQVSIGASVVIPSTVTGYQGTSGNKVQLGVGSPTAGHCANFASDGSIEDAGGACASLTQNTITFANSSANPDSIILQPGTGGTDQMGSFEFANYAGTSEWELRKDALEVFRLRDAVNGTDRVVAYQGGQTMINSAGSSAVLVNDSTGSGTGGLIVYGGGSSPTAALTVTSSGNTTAAGFLSGKFYGGNSAMGFAAGAGAGTSPTIACATNCTGAQGTYSITVGTSPSAGTLVTLNFPNTHTNAADCVGNLYLPGTGQLSNWEPVAGVSSLGIKIDGSALTAGSQYKFTYWCGGF
jgi:hypothetical protein